MVSTVASSPVVLIDLKFPTLEVRKEIRVMRNDEGKATAFILEERRYTPERGVQIETICLLTEDIQRLVALAKGENITES